MSDINDLKNRALGIRNETRTGANTANRVGQLLYDMIGYVDDNEENWESGDQGTTLRPPLSSINNIGVNPGGNNQILVYSGRNWTYTNLPTFNPDQSGNTKYTEQAFKTTSERIAPTLPTGNLPNNGWNTYISGDNSTYYVWMCTRVVTNGVADVWRGPWCLTGSGGEIGADALDIEFIYYRNNTSDPDDLTDHTSRTGTIPSGSGRVDITLTEAAYKTTDDFVPTGWNDTAEGVDEAHIYEWMSIRTKIAGEWTPFGAPFIWSHWGRNGNDGDGVEYIFYASNAPAIQGDLDAHPENWKASYPTAVGRYNRHYQDYDYVGPEGSHWEDNPFDLSATGFGPGARQWVSQRKRDHTTGEWGAFTRPALWNYYSQDGVADGYIYNLTKPNAICLTDANGHVASFVVTTGTELFYNGGRMTEYTVSVGNATINGTAVSSGNYTAVPNASDKTVTITLTNMDNVSGKTMDIPITVTFNTNQEKTLVFNILFYPPTQADSIDLCTNTTNIHFTHYRSQWSPTELEVWCLLGNNGEYTRINPADEDTQGYSFEYQYINNSQQGDIRPLTANSIADFYPDLYTSIVVYLLKDGKRLLYRNIAYTYDGAPGIGVTQYSIQPISCNIKISGTEGAQTVAGNLSFQVLKHVGNAIPEPMSPNELTPWSVVVTANGHVVASSNVGYDSSTKTFSFSLNESYDQYPYANIRLQSDNNTVLASIVVPFSVEGTKGDSWAQGFNGVVMRLVDWDEAVASDPERGYYNGQSPDSEGIYYMDIVHYPPFTGNIYSGGNYYRLKPDLAITSQNGGINPIDGDNALVPPANSDGIVNDTYWIEFASPFDSVAFQALIAEYGYISNLTGRELIITDNGTPVAGITSGHAVTGDGGEGLTDENRGNIRIWAGTPENGNLNTCNFYVTDAGILHAKNGEFSGTVAGIRGTFKSLNCVDEDNNTIGGILLGSETYDGEEYALMTFVGNVNHSDIFRANHMFVRGAFGANSTNIIEIIESGIPNTPPTVYYHICGYASPTTEDRIFTYKPLRVNTGSVNNPEWVYKIPLYFVPYTGIPNGIDYTNNTIPYDFIEVPFDTVSIHAHTKSGKLSYTFLPPGAGKKLTVVNTSNSTYASIATIKSNYTTINALSGCEMVYIPEDYSEVTSTTLGKGWFVTGDYSNS